MTETKMRARTTLAVALAGVAAVLGLLASPAYAQAPTSQTSGGALATSGSVASGTCVASLDSTCSGSGRAIGDSTSSGSAVATGGSVSSGCATAVNDSTASGAPCPPTRPPGTPGTTVPPGTTATTRPATAGPAPASAARSLALTGSGTTDLAGLAVLVLALGGVLVLVGGRRPTAS